MAFRSIPNYFKGHYVTSMCNTSHTLHISSSSLPHSLENFRKLISPKWIPWNPISLASAHHLSLTLIISLSFAICSIPTPDLTTSSTDWPCIYMDQKHNLSLQIYILVENFLHEWELCSPSCLKWRHFLRSHLFFSYKVSQKLA